jgi:hypothetical protein
MALTQRLLSTQMLDCISHDEEDAVVWKHHRVVGHQGPLDWNHPNCKGSTHSAKIEWETGEVAHEPLSVIVADDPVTCVLCANENNLLDQPGWKRFKSAAWCQKKLVRMVSQSKLRSFRGLNETDQSNLAKTEKS